MILDTDYLEAEADKFMSQEEDLEEEKDWLEIYFKRYGKYLTIKNKNERL